MSEHESLHLVDALTGEDGFYSAFYCTYGADLAFFEEVLLHPLRNRNLRQHVIFMDATRYADTIKHLRGSVSWVGRRYLVIPVHMPPFTNFHPKLVLLAGKEKGSLFLGSGNLTFTGFGHNRELYTRLDWSPDDTQFQSQFSAAWQFLREVQERWTDTTLVGEILYKTEIAAPWLLSPQTAAQGDQETLLRFLHNLQRPILDQIREALVAKEVKRITVITPFLDRKAVALRLLNEWFHPDELRLVLQQDQAVGDPEALKVLTAKGVPLEVYRFTDQQRYLHAKLLLFETEMQAFVLSGSPNCTHAALVGKTIEGRGNVEIAFLRRGDTPAHFDYLLSGVLLPENRTDVEQVGLRSDRLLPTEVDPFNGHGRHVRLHEATITGSELRLRLQLLEALPREVAGLQIQFSTVPAISIEVSVPVTDQPVVAVQLSEPYLEAIRREATISVTVQGLNGDHVAIELGCNELWVTSFDDLRDAARSGHHGAVRATGFLAEMVANSESDWRDLYLEIQRLVDLDVTRISQRSGKTADKTATKQQANHYTEKETRITLAGETRDSLELEEEEALASVIARESEFQAFFEYVRSGLPGSPRSSTDTAQPSETGRGHSSGGRRKWAPDRQMRVRFLNLVQKYVRSLHNPEYMGHVRIPDALSYYVVFQRIIWLLHTHNKTIDSDECLQLAMAINDGFFGYEIDPAPVYSPCLCRHIRYVWADDWITTEAALYSLIVLDKLRQIAHQQDNADLVERLTKSTVRVQSCLQVATDIPMLQEQIESLIPMEQAALAFDEGVEDLAVRLLDQIEQHKEIVIDTVDRWSNQARFSAKEIAEPQRVRLLYQANVDYRRALFNLLKSFGRVDGQIATARELIIWSDGAGSRNHGNKWRETLIELFFRSGQQRQGGKMLYHLGYRQFSATDYENALLSVNRARRIAEQLRDEELLSKCEHLTTNIHEFSEHRR